MLTIVKSTANNAGSFVQRDVALADYIDWLARIVGGTQQIADGRRQFEFASLDPTSSATELLDTSDNNTSRALAWLTRRIDAVDATLMARPLDRPLALHEITPQLFDAYIIEGGQMHVAGCRISDRLFAVCSLVNNHESRVVQTVVDHEAQPVDAQLIERLGLLASGPCGIHPPRMPLRDAVEVVDHASSAARKLGELGELHSVVIVLSRWATGAVEFEVADTTTRVEFADWAAELKPPPIVGPQTGAPTYHLATTHDGRLAAIEQLATSDETGHRLLKSELTKCASTGKLVERDLCLECPVTGELSLKSTFAKCETCLQKVSRQALVTGECGCCRGRSVASKFESPLAELLPKFPALAKHGRFKLSQSRDVFVVEAIGIWQRMLVVVNRTSFDPLHVATGTPFTRQWNSRSKSEWAKLLGRV